MITHFKTILLIGAMLCPALLCAQSEIDHPKYAEGREALKRADYPAAITAFRGFLPGVDSLNPIKQGELYFDLGASYFYQYNTDSAIKFMDKSLLAKEKVVPVDDITLLRTHAVLGYIHRYMRTNVRKALGHYEAERVIIKNNPDKIKDDQRFNNFYNLATSNRFFKDYDRALNYAYRALNIVQNLDSPFPEDLENCLSVIANCLNGKGQFEEASEYYTRKIETTIKNRGAKHPNLAIDYYNLASNYLDLNRPELGLEALENSLKLLDQDNRRIQPADIFALSGTALTQLERYEEAELSFNKAVNAASKRPYRLSSAYRQFARHFEERSLYDSALTYYQRAFKAVIPAFDWGELADNPDIERLQQDIHIYQVLNFKAICWYERYRKTKKQEFLKHAYETFELIDKIADHHRANYVLESSRLFFQEVNHNTYQVAIGAAYAMYEATKDHQYLERAWVIMEKNKSTLLLESLTRAENLTGLDLPDSLNSIRLDISKNLLSAQRSLVDCDNNAGCSDSLRIQFREQISKNEENLRSYQSEVAKAYPNYYQFTTDQEIQEFSTIIQNLGDNQAILNYFSSNSHFYLIASDGEKSTFQRIAKDSLFNVRLTEFLAELSGANLSGGNLRMHYEKYVENAQALFKTLLPKWIDTNQHKELIIIPDGDLSAIPFETLVKDHDIKEFVDFASLPYAIRDFSFHYGFSATLWLKNHLRSPRSPHKKLMAFGASEILNRPELAQLRGSEREINALKRIEGSEVYLNQEATEKNFKSKAKDAEIIHLALHNVNDYQNPLNSSLILNEAQQEDGSLHLYEIFNTVMSPDLVVLSGCETGIGKWERGEGAYHIGRGFIYHGNPAMIMSLWKVSDIATSTIMSQFYESLSAHENSAEAIRQAKIDYLLNADELNAHPSNWAAFIGIGQVSIKNRPVWLYYTLATLALMTILVATWRHRRRKA